MSPKKGKEAGPTSGIMPDVKDPSDFDASDFFPDFALLVRLLAQEETIKQVSYEQGFAEASALYLKPFFLKAANELVEKMPALTQENRDLFLERLVVAVKVHSIQDSDTTALVSHLMSIVGAMVVLTREDPGNIDKGDNMGYIITGQCISSLIELGLSRETIKNLILAIFPQSSQMLVS